MTVNRHYDRIQSDAKIAAALEARDCIDRLHTPVFRRLMRDSHLMGVSIFGLAEFSYAARVPRVRQCQAFPAGRSTRCAIGSTVHSVSQRW